jgi:Chaperone of endosialidase
VPTGGATDRLFQIGNGDGFTRSNALTMLRNAFTGIGNTDPAYILDLSGRMRIRGGGDLNSSAGIWLNNTTNSNQISFIGNQTDNAVGLFGNDGAGWGLVMNTISGNVGIGVLNPSQKLHVGGNIVATGTITPSDIRFKRNVSPINHALDRLLQVRGVNYWMKSAEFPEMKFDSSLQYGVIAQELEKVFPEMVFTIDKDGYKGVDYIKLVPVLIEAIKELKEENSLLQKKQSDQQKLVADILRRIELIEKKD